MTAAAPIVQTLRARGVDLRLSLDRRNVVYRAPPGVLTRDALSAARAARSEIYEFLREESCATFHAEPPLSGVCRWPVDWQEEYTCKFRLQLATGFSATPEQATWVGYHETVGLARALGQELDLCKPPPPPASWPPIYDDYARSVLARPAPSAPFELRPGVQVADAEKWIAALRADWETGPRGPRARWGALLVDVQSLDRVQTDCVRTLSGRAPGAAN